MSDWRERLRDHRPKMNEERLSPHKKPRMFSALNHYIQQVGADLAFAYHRLDDATWPSRPLVKVLLRDLDKYDNFQTVMTQRRGVKLVGGVLLLRGDGTAEERTDLHESLVVLA